MKKRNHRILNGVVLCAVLAGALVADSGMRIVTTQYDLHYENLPASFEGFRIVQLSDVHGAEFGEGNTRLLRRVAEAKPDIIAITGDLADGDSDMQVISTLLSGLSAIAPIYYISGNHEWGDGVIAQLLPLLEENGVRYLRNEFLSLCRGEEEIILVGAEDRFGPKDMIKPDALLQKVREAYPTQFVLFLGHRNDWIERYPALPANLILSGHAHGGIVRLPFVGGILGTNFSLFPKYVDGVNHCGSYDMVVSRGLGRGVAIPRFWNNPELVLIELHQK